MSNPGSPKQLKKTQSKQTQLKQAEAKAKQTQLHYKCRTHDAKNPVFYQTGKDQEPVKRPLVTDKQVPWDAEFKDYDYLKIAYTAPVVKSQPVWADPMDPLSIKNWNKLDKEGKINRKSFHGDYKFDEKTKYPLNPIGRTGIYERGLLGKWGPNHAADPIVTRWKKENGEIVRDEKTKKKILQFIAIQRVDTKEWAIPGGMCDPGENISLTLKREFFEEVLSSNDMKVNGNKNRKLDAFFRGGNKVYQGYVDDPRNTDNAWMETTAYNFHDEDGSVFDDVTLKAGDDAQNVKWVDINSSLQLYASHKDFIKKVVDSFKGEAHW